MLGFLLLFIPLDDLTVSQDEAGLGVVRIVNHHLPLSSPAGAAAAGDAVKPDKWECADNTNDMKHHNWDKKPEQNEQSRVIFFYQEIWYPITHEGHNYRG